MDEIIGNDERLCRRIELELPGNSLIQGPGLREPNPAQPAGGVDFEVGYVREGATRDGTRRTRGTFVIRGAQEARSRKGRKVCCDIQVYAAPRS